MMMYLNIERMFRLISFPINFQSESEIEKISPSNEMFQLFLKFYFSEY